MSTLFVKPKQGLKVRTPEGEHLSAEGAQVPSNSYWLRRLKDGDVEKVTELKQGAKAK